MTFWNRSGCWNSVLDRIGYPAKSEPFTQNRMQSQGTSNTNIVANSLKWLLMCHNRTNKSEVMTVEIYRCSWKFLFEPKEMTYRLRNLSLKKAWSEETLHVEVVGNFISSLKRVETQNFDIRRRDHEGFNLEGFSSCDFKDIPILKGPT
jgi:hypothetical protein